MNLTGKLFETEKVVFIPYGEITIGDVTMEIGKQSLVLRELEDGITVGIKVQVRPKGCKQYGTVGDYRVVHNGQELWNAIIELIPPIMKKITDIVQGCNPEKWDEREVEIINH